MKLRFGIGLRHLAAALLGLLGATACAQPRVLPQAPRFTPQEELQRLPARPEALSFLLDCEVFEGAHVGFAGMLSEGARHFAVVYAEPDAARLFHRVWAEGTLAGRMYALCALRSLDAEAFTQGVEEVREEDTLVSWRSGCLFGEQPVREVVPHLDEESRYLVTYAERIVGLRQQVAAGEAASD